MNKFKNLLLEAIGGATIAKASKVMYDQLSIDFKKVKKAEITNSPAGMFVNGTKVIDFLNLMALTNDGKKRKLDTSKGAYKSALKATKAALK